MAAHAVAVTLDIALFVIRAILRPCVHLSRLADRPFLSGTNTGEFLPRAVVLAWPRLSRWPDRTTRQMRVEVFNAATNRAWHRAYDEGYLPCNRLERGARTGAPRSPLSIHRVRCCVRDSSYIPSSVALAQGLAPVESVRSG